MVGMRFELSRCRAGLDGVTVARKTIERDGLAPTLNMTAGLQRPEVPQAATDPHGVTRGGLPGPAAEGEPIRETHPLQTGSCLANPF
jgi:hypothetical protein